MAAETPTAGGWSTDEEDEGGLSALQALCDLSLGSSSASIGEKRQAEASPFVTLTKPPRGSENPDVASPLIGLFTEESLSPVISSERQCML